VPERSPRFATAVATVLGVGRAPLAPGTVGSAVAVAAGVPLLRVFGPWGLLVGATLAAIAGVWAAEVVAASAGRADPSEVVIDEVAGQWIALAAAPATWAGAAAAFVLFRLFDIMKPRPASDAERLPGGIGIVADDLVAGLYAAAVLVLVARLAPGALA